MNLLRPLAYIWISFGDKGPPVQPETIEEKIVFYSLAGTWLQYFGGAIFTVPPLIGYALACIALSRMLGRTGPDQEVRIKIPLGVRLWFAGMLVMAVALLVGHVDNGFGAADTIKSFVGWMKGWALIAIFIFVGATLRIRLQIIVRAAGILALQTIVLAPVFVIAAIARLPRTLFVSPLSLLGGPGPEFFTVELYGIEPMTGAARWRFFAPWAPAAGMVAAMVFIYALYEKNHGWRMVGLLGGLVITGMSAARMAIVAIPLIPTTTMVLAHLTRPTLFAMGCVAVTIAIPFADLIVTTVEDLTNAFLNARADSTRVRATLQRIAQHRWADAPLWGHATVERGPHLVEYMPIGTHHTWNGLLFVKGAVGFAALLVPALWTLIELIAKAQSSRLARLALAQLLVILLFSLGENMESLIYLYWHGMILIGAATAQRFRNPFRCYLGRNINPQWFRH